MQYLRTHWQTLVALTLIVLVGAVGTYLIYQQGTRVPSAADQVLNPETAHELLTAEGETVSLTQYEGMVRVINSWASWSPFSRDELPMLNRLAEEYADREVVVLAINRSEPPTRAEAFRDTLPPLQNISFLTDTNDTLYASFEGYAMPETLIFNAQGDLIHHAHGPMTYDEARSFVEEALASSER